MNSTDAELPTKPAAPAATSSNSGKTFADVFDSILVTPQKWTSLVAFVFSLVLIAFVASFTKIFGVTATEMQFEPVAGSRVMFQATEKGDPNRREFLFVVHPQGWQTTDIPVPAGDHLTFRAEGTVNIDLSGIIENVQLRNRLEKDVSEKFGLKRDPAEKRVPEDFSHRNSAVNCSLSGLG